MGSRKRNRDDGDGSADECDLLKHLDDARQQELDRWNRDRCKARRQDSAFGRTAGREAGADGMQDTERCDGIVGTIPSAAQVFCALWRQVHDELVRQSSGETSEPLRASNAAAVNGVNGDQDCTSDDSGSDDLLALLDDERRKELQQLRQRRCRAKRKALQASTTSMNNVHAGEVMDTGEGVGGAGGGGDRVLDVDGLTGSGCCDSLCGARCRGKRKGVQVDSISVETVGADEIVDAEEGVDGDAESGDQVLDSGEQERSSGRDALGRHYRCGGNFTAAQVCTSSMDSVNADDIMDSDERVGDAATSGDQVEILDDRRRKRGQRVRRQSTRGSCVAYENERPQVNFDNELSVEERERCLKGLRQALSAEGLDECVCIACDRLVLRCESQRVDGTDMCYLGKMQKVLRVHESDLPPTALLDQYRCPESLMELQGAWISPRGLKTYTDEHGYQHIWLTVCKECDRSIQHGQLPKFAIANGFFVGRLPLDLQQLSVPERCMTQLANIVAMTRVMRGGLHRCIRSHCIAFDCTPGPPVSLLPRSLETVESYRVVMVGEFTAAQVEEVRKMHRVRNKQVRDAFSFYKINNHLYASIAEDEVVTSSEYTDARVERAFVEYVADPGGRLSHDMDKEQENIRGDTYAWRLLNETNECSILERRVGLSDDGTPAQVREHPIVRDGGDSKEREFEIRRSNHLANDISGTLLARVFSHLFPFGRGHPGEQRKVHVSVLECVKHYTMLSERQFARDELFTLVAFDRISLKNMYLQNHIRCQRFPHLLEGYDKLSSEQLGKALLENERRLQGCLPWKPGADSVAQKFLKTVEIGSRAVWGSNAERSQFRHKAFAYQTRFGQPALFVTLTPNTDNSLVLAQYTGISSVETLFDLLDAQLPSKAELREASRSNDCASTRLFMRQVDAFIKYALGIDPRTKKRLSFRGLLGDVKAYFGMVETQGRGTLHIHFLIWLNNCPPNSAAVNAILSSPEGPFFRARVASYANSIVRNDLPIALDKCGCSNCGASFEDLVGLPIPDLARKDLQDCARRARVRVKPREPMLIECQRCGSQCSSQHLIRNALLKARPEFWPLWERPLSTDQLEKQARTESICRHTKQQALRIVCERESTHESFSSDPISRESLTMTTELLQQANDRQMPICKAEDDPYRNDMLTRLLEISPPSPSDGRSSKEAQDYMVSALAVLLNQHLWCHTTSCFKTSGVTPSDKYCRYRFPRPHVDNTSFEQCGVELKRTLGHEFMNGYNYELMATFKCNQDIQILLGGVDVTDRIHYCCKYITKPQRRLDSQAAVAVAALKRRQQRESAEIDATGVAVPDHHAMARKRVSALVYNLTNRQEIAGPLAALYIYRKSCCYSSARCVSLPLGEIVRQLMRSEEYSCSMIRMDDGIVGDFRAVSYLDDYIFRPRTLEQVNLYEFSIWFFRKKREKTANSLYSFLDEHPLCSSHCLGKRYEEVVPVIQTFRLPGSEGGESTEKRWKYAVLSMVLFKPFRSLANLISTTDESSSQQVWVRCYEQWKPHRSEFVKEIMNNMDDFYSGLEKVKSNRENVPSVPASDRRAADSDGNTSDDNDELFHADEVDEDDSEMPDEDNDRCIINLWDIDENSSTVVDSSSLDPASCPTSVAPEGATARIIGIFKENGLLDHCALNMTSSTIDEVLADNLPSVELMKKWVKDESTDNGLVPVIQSATIAVRDTEVVEILDSCLCDSNMQWQPPTSLVRSPSLLKTFASVADVSRAFSLNERQHYAFKAVGKALLSRWRLAESRLDPGISLCSMLCKNQLLFFLGGEGGTGKSRIVDAIQTFCESWGRPQCVIKAALTGKAATLIGGRTLAGLLLQLRAKRAGSELANLDLIIVDEVSMMRKYQLSQLDKYLRIAKRAPDVPFGGVLIVLVGDFLQLPPVGGEPLYKDPSTKATLSAGELAGFQLWREFKRVVILKESVRFASDPEWGRGCQQARLGVWTPEFINLINSRVMSTDIVLDAAIAGDRTFGTFVTPDNATRISINNLFISTAARALPTGEYPVRVVANFKGKLAALRRSEVRKIMGLPDTKFGRMAPYLDLIIGMPIQITQNIRAAKLVANGTLGRLESILYHPGTTFRLVHDKEANMTVKVPDRPPPAVLVRIDRGPTARCLLGCDDADVFPLFFDTQSYNACNISLPGTANCLPRALSVRIQQFPLVCAVSSTIYKVQGETLDNMVVTEWRSACARTNKREQPYLLVSRVTSRSAFVALSPLIDDIIRWARPSQAALDEEVRLENLSIKTIEMLKAEP